MSVPGRGTRRLSLGMMLRPPPLQGIRGARLDFPEGVVGWLLAIGVLSGLVLGMLPDPIAARAAALAVAAVGLWVSGITPPSAVTPLFLAAVALALGPLDAARFGLSAAVGWCADPVLGLFFGGFALSLAFEKSGLAARLARRVVMLADGRRSLLLLWSVAATAAVSGFMSNTATCALMIAALKPILDAERGPDLPNASGSATASVTSASGPDPSFRQSLLLAVALAANVGGMATPVGTAPNAIALAALKTSYPISFVGWMALALPLAILFLAVGVGVLWAMAWPRGRISVDIPRPPPPKPGEGAPMVLVATVFGITVLAWVTESWHGVSASVTALLSGGIMFATGILRPPDFHRIDWPTLSLIAGGIALGRLIEQSGLAAMMTGAVDWASLSHTMRVAAMVGVVGVLSSIMSNTAAVALMVPLALKIDSGPDMAIMAALSASLSMPFVMSTPPNAIVSGQGGVDRWRMAVLGGVLLLVGWVTLPTLGSWLVGLVTR